LWRRARRRLYRGENDRPAPPTCLNGKQGTELADVVVNKIKQAVNAITYR
jgi:hypothetical protein